MLFIYPIDHPQKMGNKFAYFIINIVKLLSMIINQMIFQDQNSMLKFTFFSCKYEYNNKSILNKRHSMNNEQPYEFQVLNKEPDLPENAQQIPQRIQGPAYSHHSPIVQNLTKLQDSRFPQQSQQEYLSQQDNAQSINKTKHIQLDKLQHHVYQCRTCKVLQNKLKTTQDLLKGCQEHSELVAGQYKQRHDQIQNDKNIFREHFKANQDVLTRLNEEVMTAVNENNQLRQKLSHHEQLKLDYEAQQRKINDLEQCLGTKLTQEEQHRSELKLKQEQIKSLNAKIQQLSQKLIIATREMASLNEQLPREIQNIQRSLETKYQMALQALESKSQDEKYVLINRLERAEGQLSQEKKKSTEQIARLRKENKELVDGLDIQKKFHAQRLSDYENDCRNVEQKAILLVNDMICRLDRSIASNKQKVDQDLSAFLNIIRQETLNSNKLVDEIVALQEKINNLMLNQTKNLSQLAIKNQELRNCQNHINSLKDERQKLITDFNNLKQAYEQEFSAINQALSQKLDQNRQQSSRNYEKILNEQEERGRLKLQTVLAELELAQQMKIMDTQRFQEQQTKHLAQIKLLKRHIQSLEQKIVKNEELRELELNAKRSQIIKEMQKFRQVEATSQKQQGLIQQLQSEVALFNKTLNFIHRQLDDKSLKEVIALIDGQQQTQYYLSLLDLINCIYYQQNQKDNEVISLNLKIRALQRQKESIVANSGESATKIIETNRRLMDYQKKQAVLSEKVARLDEQAAQLRNINQVLRQQNEKANTSLKQKTQQLQLVTSVQAQANKSARDIQNENIQLKDNVEQLKRELVYNKKVYEQMTTNLKNSFRNEKAQMDQNAANKAQVEALQSKIKTLIEQNEQLKRKSKNQDSILTEKVSLKAAIAKLEQQNKRQKERSQALLQNKSTYERQLRQAKEKLIKVEEMNRQLTNKLKVKDEQAKISRQSPTISKQIEKTSVNDERIKQLQLRNQILQADIEVMKKNKKTLQEKIYQLRREIDDKKSQKVIKQTNKELSWSQSQEYMKGYENIIQSLRQEKTLLEQEIEALKTKIKRLQGNNRAPKSYISPGRSAIMAEKSPPKKVQMPEKVQKIEVPQIPRENLPQVKRYPIFGVNCLLDEQETSRGFLLKKIEELFVNKKIVQTRIVYKFTEASKAFSFTTLIPKAQLQSQTFIFLFSTKTDIFGVLSYKKDAISKQTAMLFSTNTQKVVLKRPTGDSVTATPVIVEFSGQLNIGNGHLKMKSSSKTIMVKEVLGKYFEPYEKKDIYGKDYWRDEMAIELTEFQIHKIYLK